MPYAAKKICGKPGCGKLSDASFCPAHLAEAPERQWDRERGSAHARGYGRRHAKLRLTPSAVNDLIRRVVQRIAPLAHGKRIAVTTFLSQDLPAVWLDQELLSRTLDNLIGNAMKFTPEEGKVVTWTVVHTGHPEFGDQTPYALVVVEFGKGARLLMQLADFRREDLKIGRKVKVEFRKIQAAGESGVLCYGYKAVACSE